MAGKPQICGEIMTAQMQKSQFFNIQHSNDGALTIYLYGEIGDYADVRCAEVAAELMAAAPGARINLRINSIGGEVYSGIAIYNAVLNSRGDVHIYVDGVAASMAGVIALCGRPVEMSRYARLMLHSVSGGCYGNRQELQRCLEEIAALEDSLADIIGRRLNIPADAVKTKYFDGRDHWMTAQEALSGGFVDGIYDSEEAREGGESGEGEEERDTTTPRSDMTADEIYETFNNRLRQEAKPDNTTMDLKTLKKRARFAACADDAAAMAELDKLEAEACKVANLEAENTKLKNELAAHKEEIKEREEKERKELLDAAEKDGRITASTRPTFENILKADFANGKAALEAMRPRRSVMKDIHPGEGGGEGGENYSGKSWDDLDRSGLLGEVKAKHPEVYKAKFKARFGVEPTL